MSNLVEQYFKSCNHKKQMFDRKKYGRHLSDNRVISGGDFMEHPVYPLHSFLILCCHSIILLIIVFHATTFQSTNFFFKILWKFSLLKNHFNNFVTFSKHYCEVIMKSIIQVSFLQLQRQIFSSKLKYATSIQFLPINYKCLSFMEDHSNNS